MGEPAFVPIIHTDNNVLDLLYSYEDPQVVRRTLKVYRHVRNMVIRTVLAQKKKMVTCCLAPQMQKPY